jgi:hypothetical protein
VVQFKRLSPAGDACKLLQAAVPSVGILTPAKSSIEVVAFSFADVSHCVPYMAAAMRGRALETEHPFVSAL